MYTTPSIFAVSIAHSWLAAKLIDLCLTDHSDHEGRYDYRKQPSMILFAIAQLSSTLAEAIGAETETGKAIGKGWADVEDQDKLEEWRQVGLEFGEEVETAAMKVFKAEYQKLYSKVSLLQ
jgi:uncharacterized protein YdiU (UPF0061 family)